MDVSKEAKARSNALLGGKREGLLRELLTHQAYEEKSARSSLCGVLRLLCGGAPLPSTIIGEPSNYEWWHERSSAAYEGSLLQHTMRSFEHQGGVQVIAIRPSANSACTRGASCLGAFPDLPPPKLTAINFPRIPTHLYLDPLTAARQRDPSLRASRFHRREVVQPQGDWPYATASQPTRERRRSRLHCGTGCGPLRRGQF